MKYTVNEKEVEGVRREPARVSKVLISGHTVGSTQIAMGTNVTEVGSRIPVHSHGDSEEAMFIASGRGKLVVNGGEAEYPLEAGTAIFAPKGVSHEIVNTGDEPIKVIWAYAPPLPEHLK